MGEKQNRDSVPKTTRPWFDAVVELTDQVCSQYLNEEYGALARSLAAALARKRPCPLTRGRINTWACGVVYAVGAANFLFDPAQMPHMRGADVCAAFGVSGSAGAAKGREIMRMFHIGQLDPQWCLPSKLADNPLAWFVEINGFVVDARGLAPDVQEELHRRGLIPFVPGTRLTTRCTRPAPVIAVAPAGER
jgi:hypothetical protein